MNMKMGTEFWEEHVAAAKLESISASEYARRHGFAVSALYYWQRKLKSPTSVRAAAQASKFVALRVADAAGEPPGHYMLALPSGLTLSMSALPAAAWLAALARAVSGAH